MRIVIDIPDEEYECIQSGKVNLLLGGRCGGKMMTINLYKRVRNGTPLPKGHGRLIDKDKMIRDLLTVDEQYETDVDFCLSVIESYDVIVEADKEGAEE